MEIAARRHVVEVGAEEAVEHEEDQPHGDGREGQDDEELDDQGHPHEHRHAHERHAGRPRLRMVTMKLTPAMSEETPRTCRPSTQKSMAGPGEYSREVRLT